MITHKHFILLSLFAFIVHTAPVNGSTDFGPSWQTTRQPRDRTTLHQLPDLINLSANARSPEALTITPLIHFLTNRVTIFEDILNLDKIIADYGDLLSFFVQDTPSLTKILKGFSFQTESATVCFSAAKSYKQTKVSISIPLSIALAHVYADKQALEGVNKLFVNTGTPTEVADNSLTHDILAIAKEIRTITGIGDMRICASYIPSNISFLGDSATLEPGIELIIPLQHLLKKEESFTGFSNPNQTNLNPNTILDVAADAPTYLKGLFRSLQRIGATPRVRDGAFGIAPFVKGHYIWSYLTLSGSANYTWLAKKTDFRMILTRDSDTNDGTDTALPGEYQIQTKLGNIFKITTMVHATLDEKRAVGLGYDFFYQGKEKISDVKVSSPVVISDLNVSLAQMQSCYEHRIFAFLERKFNHHRGSGAWSLQGGITPLHSNIGKSWYLSAHCGLSF